MSHDLDSDDDLDTPLLIAVVVAGLFAVGAVAVLVFLGWLALRVVV